MGNYCEYVLDSYGVEKRIRKQIVLCPVKDGEQTIGKRVAMKLLQPFVDRVNSSIAAPARERKSITLEAFTVIWERDYLSLSKPSTQNASKSYVKKLNAAFGKQDMRRIDAGDLQRLVAQLTAEGVSPKTIRNMWGTVSLIWQAALAQKYVDAVLPKPKMPKRPKTKARFFTLDNVASLIATSQGEQRVFYWLAAETGLRAGELAGLKLTDIAEDCLTVNQSVWQGKEQAPKTDNAVRSVALSSQLVQLLWEQITRQKAKGHDFLFTSANGTPWDMNVFRQRKLKRFLKELEIPTAGFHAFRHFNVSVMDALRVPLKTIQERIGHALTGSFTLDVYGGQPEWKRNQEAARLLGAEIEKAAERIAFKQTEQKNHVPFVCLTAINENGLGDCAS